MKGGKAERGDEGEKRGGEEGEKGGTSVQKMLRDRGVGGGRVGRRIDQPFRHQIMRSLFARHVKGSRLGPAVGMAPHEQRAEAEGVKEALKMGARRVKEC